MSTPLGRSDLIVFAMKRSASAGTVYSGPPRDYAASDMLPTGSANDVVHLALELPLIADAVVCILEEKRGEVDCRHRPNMLLNHPATKRVAAVYFENLTFPIQYLRQRLVEDEDGHQAPQTLVLDGIDYPPKRRMRMLCVERYLKLVLGSRVLFPLILRSPW